VQLAGVALLGWATAAWALWGWLGRLSTPGWSAAVVVGASAAAGGYVLVARGLGALLAPSVSAVPAGAVPGAVGLAAVVVLGALTVAVRDPRVRTGALGRRAWVLASGVGRTPAPSGATRARPEGAAPPVATAATVGVAA